jgi:hypothetical protein
MFWTVSLLPLERLGLVVHSLPLAYESFRLAQHRGGPETSAGFTGIVVNNFNFISIDVMRLVDRDRSGDAVPGDVHAEEFLEVAKVFDFESLILLIHVYTEWHEGS